MRTITYASIAWTIMATAAAAQTTTAIATSTSGSWTMYHHDVHGTRSNDAECTLSPTNVGGLRQLWSYATPGPVYATPAVQGNRVYVGDTRGNFYALSTDGALIWKTTGDGGAAITASALVLSDRIVVGDLKGKLYAFSRSNGSRLWAVQLDSHPFAAIYGSAIPVGSDVVVGMGSTEEGAAGTAGYVCCSSRGSVSRVRASDGHIQWQTKMVSDSEKAAGSSGATVWSTPTYDSATATIFVTTGNNFSAPATGKEDAFVALNASTGAIRWVNQRTTNDIWNFSMPASDEHPDYDFGDSPQFYRLPSGRKVIAAGQKNGNFHVIDAGTGKLVNTANYAPGAALGGVFADSGFGNGLNYLNANEWPNGGAPTHGYLVAVNASGVGEVWRKTINGSTNMSGPAIANGIVYFVSTFNGNLYALDGDDGSELAVVAVGPSVSGPAVVNGRVYLGTGAFSFAPPPTATGSIVGLGL